ncbi:MAG: carboxylesterase family protein [Steroidobacteraceae bacterium]
MAYANDRSILRGRDQQRAHSWRPQPRRSGVQGHSLPAPVYRYRDDFRSGVPIVGTDWTLRACHASDIAIVFYNYEMTDLQGRGPGLPAASKAMSGYFASFARSGVPVAEGQPAWPRYQTATRAVMLLDTRCRVAMDPDGEARKLWRSLGWT